MLEQLARISETHGDLLFGRILASLARWRKSEVYPSEPGPVGR
jgi:hypothetical protein